MESVVAHRLGLLVLIAAMSFSVGRTAGAEDTVQSGEAYIAKMREAVSSVKTLSIDFTVKTVAEIHNDGVVMPVSASSTWSVRMKDGKFLVRHRYEGVGGTCEQIRCVKDGKVYDVRDEGDYAVITEQFESRLPEPVNWLLPQLEFLRALPEDLSQVDVREVESENGEKLIQLSYQGHSVQLDGAGTVTAWTRVSPLTDELQNAFLPESSVRVYGNDNLNAGDTYTEKGSVLEFSTPSDEKTAFPVKIRLVGRSIFRGMTKDADTLIHVLDFAVNQPLKDEEVEIQLKKGMRVVDVGKTDADEYVVDADGNLARPGLWQRFGDWIMRAWTK